MDKSGAIAYIILGIWHTFLGIAGIIWSSSIGRYSEDGSGGVVFGGLVCLILGLLSLGAGLSRLEEKK